LLIVNPKLVHQDLRTMPIRQLPRTIAERQRTLYFIWNQLTADPLAPHPFMADTVARLLAFQPYYAGLVLAQNSTKAAQTASTANVARLRNLTRTWVAQGYTSIVSATVRGTFAKSVLALYRLPTNAQGGPRLVSESDILAAATTLADGEAVRIAAGGQPIAFPSVAEIMGHADAFKAANLAQDNAQNAYSDARKAVALANKEANKLILRLWNEAEAAFDTGDLPSMRRKARLWGILYVKSRLEPPTAETNAAMGHVTLGTSDKALRQVIVAVVGTDISTKTNANGRYALPLMEAGTYTVFFRLKGHIPVQHALVVVESEMLVLDVRLAAD